MASYEGGGSGRRPAEPGAQIVGAQIVGTDSWNRFGIGHGEC